MSARSLGTREHVESALSKQIPTARVVLLCLAVLVLPVALVADAHEPRFDGSGKWIHHHTRSYTYCNEISTSNELQLHNSADNAAGSWDNLSTTGIEVPEQGTCHPTSGAAAHVELRAANYGDTSWRMTVWSDPSNPNPAGYHATHTHMLFNREKLSSAGIGSAQKRTLACKGFGQVFGLDTVEENANSNHSLSDRDCMSFRGSFVTEKIADDYPTTYDFTKFPGPHSRALLKSRYDTHQGPDIGVGGSLWSGIDNGVLDFDEHELEVTATGETGSVLVDEISVSVDDDEVEYEDCQGVVICSLSTPWQFDPEEFGSGSIEVTVVAVDTEGFESEFSFDFVVAEEPEVLSTEYRRAASRLGATSCVSGDPMIGDQGSGACKTSSESYPGGFGGISDLQAVVASPDGVFVYAVSGVDDAVAVAAYDEETGDLEYEGCVSGNLAVAECDSASTATSTGLASGLDNPVAIAVTNSGENLYVISSGDHAVSVFDRNLESGEIEWANCISSRPHAVTSEEGPCEAMPKVREAWSGFSAPGIIEISHDDELVAVATHGGDQSVVVFDREPQDGSLEFVDCIAGDSWATNTYEYGVGACREAPGATPFGVVSTLAGVSDIVFSPDSTTLYVSSEAHAAISEIGVDLQGEELVWLGCISGSEFNDSPSPNMCRLATEATIDGSASGMDGLVSLAMAPDGRFVFAAATHDRAISAFSVGEDRSLEWESCLTGSGGYVAGCETRLAADGNGLALAGLDSVSLSGDGLTMVAAASDSDSLFEFGVEPRQGRLFPQGCMSADRTVVREASFCRESAVASRDGHLSGLDGVSGLSTSASGSGGVVAISDDQAIIHAEIQGSIEPSYCVTGSQEINESGTESCSQLPWASPDGVDTGMGGLTGGFVAPDGVTVYTVSAEDDSVVWFSRDPGSGQVTFSGCVSARTFASSSLFRNGRCTELPAATANGAGSGMDGPSGIIVSPDGEMVFVSSLEGISLFSRDTADGDLEFSACASGSTQASTVGGGPCVGAPVLTANQGKSSGLYDLRQMALSPGGGHVVAASGREDSSIAVFALDVTQTEIEFVSCVSARTGATDLPLVGSGNCEPAPGATAFPEGSVLSGTTGVVFGGEDGQELFVVAADSSVLSRYSWSEVGAELDFEECLVAALSSSSSGSCDPLPSGTADGAGSGMGAPSALDTSEDGLRVFVSSVADESVAVVSVGGGAMEFEGCTSLVESEFCEGSLFEDSVSFPDGGGIGSLARGGGGHRLIAAVPNADLLLVLEYGVAGPEMVLGECAGASRRALRDLRGACEEMTGSTPSGAASGFNGPRVLSGGNSVAHVYAISGRDSALGLHEPEAVPVRSSCISGLSQAALPDISPECISVRWGAIGGAGSGLAGMTDVVVSLDGNTAYAVSSDEDAIAVFGVDETGTLEWLGCISGDESLGEIDSGTGPCALVPGAASDGVGSGMDGARAVGISPDGAFVYVAATTDNAITYFRRDVDTGMLEFEDCATGVTVPAGSGGSGACLDLDGATSSIYTDFAAPTDIEISADGERLAALGSQGRVATLLERDLQDGGLEVLSCISGDTRFTGDGPCQAIPEAGIGTDNGLSEGDAIAIAGDGLALYIASPGLVAVTELLADGDTGELEFGSCVTGSAEGLGSGGLDHCADIPIATADGSESGLAGVDGIAASLDGRHVYASAGVDNSVIVFDRAEIGGLSFAGCVADISGCELPPTFVSEVWSGLTGMSVSPSDDVVWVASSDSDALIRMERNKRSGLVFPSGCYTGSEDNGPIEDVGCVVVESATADGVGSGLRTPTGVAAVSTGVVAISQPDAAASIVGASDPGERMCLSADLRVTADCAKSAWASEHGDSTGMDEIGEIVATPDGNLLFGISSVDDALFVVSHDADNGGLRFAGCVTGSDRTGIVGPSGPCVPLSGATEDGVGSGLDGPVALAVDPEGRNLYVSGSDGVATFEIDEEGELPEFAGCTTGDPDLVIAEDGPCASLPYLGGAAGALSGLNTAQRLIVHADGGHLVAVSGDAEESVMVFEIDSLTGLPVFASCITGNSLVSHEPSGNCKLADGASPGGGSGVMADMSDAVFSANGERLYVVSNTFDSVSWLDLDPGDGGLEISGCITGDIGGLGSGGEESCEDTGQATADGSGSGLAGPQSVSASPDGSFVYVAASGDSAIARITVNPVDGSLGYLDCISSDSPASCISDVGAPDTEDLFTGISSLDVSPDGGHLAFASAEADAMVLMARNAKDGSLGFEQCYSGDDFHVVDVDGACSPAIGNTASGLESGLDEPGHVMFAPVGTAIYGVSAKDDAIQMYQRDVPEVRGACITGSTEAADPEISGCVPVTWATTDGEASGLGGLQGLAASTFDPFVYALSPSEDAVVVFERLYEGDLLAYRGCYSGDANASGSGDWPEPCHPIESATPGGVGSGLDDPRDAALSPDGSRLLVTAAGDGAVTVFDRDFETGELVFAGCVSAGTLATDPGLAECSEFPVLGIDPAGSSSGLGSPQQIEIDPGGEVAVVTTMDKAIVVFSLSANGPPLEFGACLSGDLDVVQVGGSVCDATPGATAGGGDSPFSGEVSIGMAEENENGVALYVGSSLAASVSTILVDPLEGAADFVECATGATEVAGSSSSLAPCMDLADATPDGSESGMAGLSDVTVTSDGHHVFAVSEDDAALSQFRRYDDGLLNYQGCIDAHGSTSCEVSLGRDPGSSGMDSFSRVESVMDGLALLVSSNDGTLSVFNRNPQTGQVEFGECMSGNSLATSATTEPCSAVPLVSTALGSGTGMGGSLDLVAGQGEGHGFAYLTSSGDDSIRVIALGEVAEPFSCITGETEAGVLDGSGACLEVEGAAEGAVGSGLAGATKSAASPDGQHIYTVASGDSSIYTSSFIDGVITPHGCITGDTTVNECDVIVSASSGGTGSGLAEPSDVAVSADGRFVYVASHGDAAISVFDRDLESGQLEWSGCITGNESMRLASYGPCDQEMPTIVYGQSAHSGLASPVALSVSTDGGRLLVADTYVVAAFDIDDLDGSLSLASCLTSDLAKTDSPSIGYGSCDPVSGASSLPYRMLGLSDVEAVPTDDGLALSASSTGIGLVAIDPYGVLELVDEYGSGPIESFNAVAVSPDGARVVGVSGPHQAIAGFALDGEEPDLSSEGCVSVVYVASCEHVDVDPDHSGMGNLSDVVVSSGGEIATVSSARDDAMSYFSLADDGSVQIEGCVTADERVGPDGSGACSLAEVTSPDGGPESGMDQLSSLTLVQVTEDTGPGNEDSDGDVIADVAPSASSAQGRAILLRSSSGVSGVDRGLRAIGYRSLPQSSLPLHSGKRGLLPIASSWGAAKQFVALSVRPKDLPQMNDGGAITVTGEQQMTHDCEKGMATGRDTRCAEVEIEWRAILASGESQTSPIAAFGKWSKTSCTAMAHHCGIRINKSINKVPSGCQPANCHMNLVLRAAAKPASTRSGLKHIAVGRCVQNSKRNPDTRKIEKAVGCKSATANAAGHLGVSVDRATHTRRAATLSGSKVKGCKSHTRAPYRKTSSGKKQPYVLRSVCSIRLNKHERIPGSELQFRIEVDGKAPNYSLMGFFLATGKSTGPKSQVPLPGNGNSRESSGVISMRGGENCNDGRRCTQIKYASVIIPSDKVRYINVVGYASAFGASGKGANLRATQVRMTQWIRK